ncbi:MAG: hypothetical protein AAGE61_18200 [Pseudomonadota bacterium]
MAQNEDASGDVAAFSPPSVTVKPRLGIVSSDDLNLWLTAAETVKGIEDLCEETKRLAEKDREAECKRGYREGFDRGARDVAQVHFDTQHAANVFLKMLKNELPEIVDGILKKIIGEFERHDLMHRAIHQAISQQSKSLKLSVRVPEDFVRYLAEDCTPDEQETLAGISLEIDQTLDNGRCVLESELGLVNLGIEDQLAAVKTHLKLHSDRCSDG